jgi:hypothetical protein
MVGGWLTGSLKLERLVVAGRREGRVCSDRNKETITLVIAAKEDPSDPVPPQDARCYITLSRGEAEYDSVWRGHPLRIEGSSLKDGTRVSMTLDLDEAARLFALIRDSDQAEDIRNMSRFVKFAPEQSYSWAGEDEDPAAPTA